MEFLDIKVKASELLDSSRSIIVKNEKQEQKANDILKEVNSCIDEVGQYANSAKNGEFQSVVSRLTAALSFVTKAMNSYMFNVKSKIEAKENLEKLREEKRRMIMSTQTSLLNKTVVDGAKEIKKELLENIKPVILKQRGRPKKELVTA